MTEYLMKMKVEAAGTVRRCAPYDPDSTCPACGRDRSPLLLGIGKRRHPVESVDDVFVQRTCGHCGMQWREFHTEETKG